MTETLDKRESNRPRHRRPLLALVALSVVLACGADEEGGRPEDALEAQFELLNDGRFADLYEELHPLHQSMFDRRQFVACYETLFGGIEAEVQRIERVAEVDYDVPATNEIVAATEITFEFATGAGDSAVTVSDTAHLAQADGRWRWFLAEPDRLTTGLCT